MKTQNSAGTPHGKTQRAMIQDKKHNASEMTLKPKPIVIHKSCSLNAVA